MSKEHKIKVMVADKFKRESVMLDLKGRTIAKGKNKMELVKQIYGK